MAEAEFEVEFRGLSRKSVDAIARNPLEPRDRRHAARRFLKRTVDTRLETAKRDVRAGSGQIRGLTDQLTGGGATGGRFQPQPAAASANRRIRSVSTKTDYSAIAHEYVALYDRATPKTEELPKIDVMRGRIAVNRRYYNQISAETSVPWHIIGLIHGAEANFSFERHLHNGDPLTARTVNAPAGRPPASFGEAPFLWADSAIDALEYTKMDVVPAWTLSRQLFELEKYNGFGYRYQGLPSPYLWCLSNHYETGKYTSDGEFDQNAVSRQPGLAVVLKRMVEKGDIAEPLRAI